MSDGFIYVADAHFIDKIEEEKILDPCACGVCLFHRLENTQHLLRFCLTLTSFIRVRTNRRSNPSSLLPTRFTSRTVTLSLIQIPIPPLSLESLRHLPIHLYLSCKSPGLLSVFRKVSTKQKTSGDFSSKCLFTS